MTMLEEQISRIPVSDSTPSPTLSPTGNPGGPTGALPVPIAGSREATKIYGEKDSQVRALNGVSVDFMSGEFTAIMGPSGSGKSTLMHCCAGLDRLSSGSVFLGQTDLSSLKDDDLTRLRRDRLGFVFQAFNLIPTLTAKENIVLPMRLAKRAYSSEVFDSVIETVGLHDRLDHRPSELSGGQQQRVAVARALLGQPEILFADEPTGNLDSRSGAEVLRFLREAASRYGQTIVMVTHDPSAAGFADRVVFLADGQIVDEMFAPTADRVLDRMKRFER
jgi:putative ABC transport system ATP-binding protein